MGEYLAAPALLDEPAVQQSFLSYFNTIVVSPGDGACLSWSVMRALLLMPPCVVEVLGTEWLTEKTALCAIQLLETHGGEVQPVLEVLMDEHGAAK